MSSPHYTAAGSPPNENNTAQLTAVLLHLRQVRDAMTEIQSIAGVELEHFRTLRQTNIRAFERTLSAFINAYRNFAELYGDDIPRLCLVQEDFYAESAVRAFSHFWAYKKARKEAPNLRVGHICVRPTHAHTLNDRVRIARRLYMVESSGQHQYPPPEHSIAFLRQNLGQNHAWLLDFGALLTYETSKLVAAIGKQTAMVVYWPEKSAALHGLAVKRGHLQVRVQDITTNATQGKLEDGNGNCHVCFEEFSLGIEQAVVPCCGHVVGADCLQVWLNGGGSTCTHCRQQICSTDEIPRCYRQEHAEYENVLRSLQAHDRDSDLFLREGNFEIHSERFADHLNEMFRLIEENKEILDSMLRKCRARPQA